jgi:putative hydrolase of the HAD superfamily
MAIFLGRAVSFDLDATLLDNGFIPDTIRACCEYVAGRIAVDGDTVAKENATAFADYWPRIEQGWALGSRTGEQMIREVWRRALASCGCDDPEILDDLIVEHLRLDRANARLFDDVRPAIDELRAGGVRLALITNGASDTQRTRLASLGIDEWFDIVVISSEIGAVKPDGAVFASAANGLGVDGVDLWHVGDNLETDVAGALSAGHTAVWLNRGGVRLAAADPVPHVELASLRDLPATLRR